MNEAIKTKLLRGKHAHMHTHRNTTPRLFLWTDTSLWPAGLSFECFFFCLQNKSELLLLVSAPSPTQTLKDTRSHLATAALGVAFCAVRAIEKPALISAYSEGENILEFPFMRLFFTGSLFQAMDDVIEVCSFLLAQAAVSGVAHGRRGRVAAVGEAEQAVQSAGCVVAAAALFHLARHAVALRRDAGIQVGLKLRGAFGPVAVVVVSLAGLGGLTGRGGTGPCCSLDLLNEELPPDPGPGRSATSKQRASFNKNSAKN